MRKLLFAAAAATVVLAPGVASAQSAREVHQDQREVRKDQREVRRDVARGDFNEARHDRRETREDRRELREDWQDYRRNHRDAFHRSAYVAPRGFRYRPVAIGARLNRAFYGRSYWVNDYATYRLPRPGYHQAYVRYGNDVLLVNTRNGRVIRVYSGFYW
jgi:Ni/Co efflux regulator RcnB